MAIDQPPFAVFGPDTGQGGTPGQVPAPPPGAGSGHWVICGDGVWRAQSGGGGGIDLQTDGSDNADQSLLNLISGTNIVLAADGSGGVTVNATASPLGPGSHLTQIHATLTSAQIRSLSSSPVTLVNGITSTYLVPVSGWLRYNPGSHDFGPTIDEELSATWWSVFGPGSPANQPIMGGVFRGLSQSFFLGTSGGPFMVAPTFLATSSAVATMLFGTQTAQYGLLQDEWYSFNTVDPNGSDLILQSDYDLSGSGLLTATVSAGGTGYATGDTFFVWGLGNGNATGHVSAQSGGVVSAVTIDTPGSGYLVDSNSNFALNSGSQTGTGSGLQVTAASVDSNIGNGTLDIWLVYYNLPVS